MIRLCPFAMLLMLAPVLVSAQPLGTFRWQLEPYCNVVTLAVTQSGSVYEVEGTDDQCAAATAASASGTAFLNPDGSIGFGLNIVTSPSAAPVHIEASIGLSTLSGTWHDSAGGTGTFRFTPGARTGGAPRPAATLGLSGVTLGFGLVSSGGPGNVTLSTNLEQIETGLEMRTPNNDPYSWNLGLGPGALAAAQPGASDNIAVGHRAMESLTTGRDNVALGSWALTSTTEGHSNTSVGLFSTANNRIGIHNAALGAVALAYNSSGNYNVAIGSNALTGNREGSDNIAIGFKAGATAYPAASNNIYLGNIGFGPDNGTIRIGNETHVGTVIAGIAGKTSVGGVGVFINAGGRMGTLTSSARFKDDIQPIGDVRGKLATLKPVRFVYKAEYDDGSQAPQFGLIAEEVAATFPELALLDDQGRPETVRYHLLTPLLLAEIQRLERECAAQAEELRSLRERVAQLEARDR